MFSLTLLLQHPQPHTGHWTFMFHGWGYRVKGWTYPQSMPWNAYILKNSTSSCYIFITDCHCIMVASWLLMSTPLIINVIKLLHLIELYEIVWNMGTSQRLRMTNKKSNRWWRAEYLKEKIDLTRRIILTPFIKFQPLCPFIRSKRRRNVIAVPQSHLQTDSILTPNSLHFCHSV